MRKLVKKITTKVVGVTFNNEDGSSRQDNIALLSVDDEVNLELYFYNEEPAYLVTDIHGEGIGVLNKELAAEIYENYDCKGCDFDAWVSDIRGGEDGKSYGCSIKIIVYDESYEDKNKYTPSRTQIVKPNPIVTAPTPKQTNQTETSEPKAEEAPPKQAKSTVKMAPVKNKKGTYKLASMVMYIAGPILIALGLLLLFAVPATGVISIALGVVFLFTAKKYKKMITSKKLLIVIAVLLVLFFATIIATPTPDSDTTTAAGETTAAEVTTTEAATTEAATTEPTTEPTTEAISLEFKNALKKAESYLRISAFSKKGLIDQLEYEGFSGEACEYAVENCEVDWNEQAAKKAQSYLDISSFSRQGLYDQLKYEGFTTEQIEYGLKTVGY